MIRKLICINSVIIAALAAFFLVYPSFRAALDIRDPALRQPGVPQAAWKVYRSLTPRYATWARQRVAEGRAASMSTEDISGTEWPVFGSVFYLWGIENLQHAWEGGDHTGGAEPKVFAREAVIAASELVVDPNHASWVKKHWGDNYLHRENAFYRMVVIAALTTRENLLHDHAHLDLLRDQVETLANDVDSSRTGLLDDYPGQCFPGDVMAAWMCIKRADAVLGTDHSTLIGRGLRGFVGLNATRHQLPPYSASSKTGLPESEARGCANSYMCLTSPELWPGQARLWYSLYDKSFWQQHMSAAGYREFPKDVPGSEWTVDVDAGPVIAGYGVSANAFGVGAARKNGRFDRAYPLAAEMPATVGELPNGVLLLPRLLSNLSDAPLLGEAGILWQLTIEPEKGFPITTGGSLPPYVYLVLMAAFLFGAWRIFESIETIRRARRPPEPRVWAPGFQVAVWIFLMLGSAITFWTGHGMIGTLALVLGAMLPIAKRRPATHDEEDWPEANRAAIKK